MADTYLRNLTQQDSEPTRSIVIQRWIKLACINAGASLISMDPYLRDLQPNDSEPVRAMVIQRWLTLLSSNVGGGGGGGTTVKSGNVALSANDQSKAVVFSTPFSSTPVVVAGLVTPDGTVIPINPSAVTANGFTGTWGTPIAAGWIMTWQATLPSNP